MWDIGRLLDLRSGVYGRSQACPICVLASFLLMWPPPSSRHFHHGDVDVEGIQTGSIRWVSRASPIPSPLSFTEEEVTK